MCIFNEGDRVMRTGSTEVYTVTQTSMAGCTIEDRHGHSIPRLPGAYLRTLVESVRHHAEALTNLAAELGDEALDAAATLATLRGVMLCVAEADDDDVEVA